MACREDLARPTIARRHVGREDNRGAAAGMTTLDWLIVAFVAVLALFGLRQGFIVGVLSFGGFALGAFLGTRLGPLLLPAGLLLALRAGVRAASARCSPARSSPRGLEGVGWRLRRVTALLPGLGLLDGVRRRCSRAAVGLGIVWIVAAVVAQVPGPTQLRADVQRSAILRRPERADAALRVRF